MKEKVETVFALVADAIAKAKQELADLVREATIEGRFPEAQRIVLLSQELERASAQLQAARDRWLAARHAELVKEIFETAGRGERAARRRSRATHIQRGVCTPPRHYRLPILRALGELGGEAPAAQVLERVFAEVKDHLRPADHEEIPYPHAAGGAPRWRRTAENERFRMVQEGLLRSDSPRGTWALTAQGRRFLEEAQEAKSVEV